MYKVIQNYGECVGCSICVRTCPNLFKIKDEEGVAVLKNAKQNGSYLEKEVDNKECAEHAANYCPLQIIEIRNL